MKDSWTHDPGAVADSDRYFDINLMVLLRYLVQSWRFVLICCLVTVTMTACDLRGATAIYEAQMVVAPMEGDSGGAGGSQSLTTKVLSSLSLGGGGGGGQQFDEFQYKLTSPSVIHAANADGKLYSWLYAGQWDPQTRAFRKPEDFNQMVRGAIRRFFHRPEWYPQDDVLTSEMLSQQIAIAAVPKSTLTRISYNNANPAIAAAVLRRLFSEADRELRNTQRARLKAQIANANEMLASTQVADYRMAMAQVLANSQYRLMNVPDNIDYAAHVVEAPYVSPVPISPKPGLSLAITFITTLFVASFVGIGYRILRAEYDSKGEDLPVVDPMLRLARNLLRR